MEAEVYQSSTFDGMSPGITNTASLGACVDREYSIGGTCASVLREQVERIPCERHSSALSVLCLVEGEGPTCEVYVRPVEGQQLLLTCASRYGEHDDGIQR